MRSLLLNRLELKMVPLPNLRSKVVNTLGFLIAPWNSFLQQFVQAPPTAMPITVGASPFTFTASEPGILTVVPGTISSIVFGRGSVTANITGQRSIPVCLNDYVIITYSVIPTVRFFPSYGNTPS